MARSSRNKKHQLHRSATCVDAAPRTDGKVEPAPAVIQTPTAEPAEQASDLIDTIDSHVRGLQEQHASPPVSDSILQSVMMINSMLTQLNDQQQQIMRQRTELQQARETLQPREAELRDLERDLFSRSDALDLQAQQLEQAERELAAKQAKTASQRRAIANQFRAQRAENTSTPSVDDAQLHQMLADSESQHQDEKRQILAELHHQHEAELDAALSAVETERAARQQAEENLQAAEQRLQTIEDHSPNPDDESDQQLATLQQAVEGLRSQRDQAQDEIEELKNQNRELAAKLASQQVNDAGTSGQVSLESMSWEQRKLHMLQRLNAEDDDDQSGDAAQRRLKIDEVIDRTDRELAKRDAEIAELRCLLEQQSMAAGDVAIGGAAVLQMLDQDELIREEREKLQRIQTEWEEKLRQAEIDVSLERAKLARERIDIEQRLAEMREATKAEAKPESKGRKWLAQLGLTDGE